MNANTNEDELIINNKQTVEVAEDFGCASDCVRSARKLVMDAAAQNEDNPNDHDIYMIAYKGLYSSCYSRC